MQDLLDDLIELKKDLIVDKIATQNKEKKMIYKKVVDRLTEIILEHEEFTVPF